MSVPDKQQRDAWRKLASSREVMTSAINEYCPSEFLELLDAVDELEKENTELKRILFKALLGV